MWWTFIQVSALILTLEAAFFLAKGNLGLSAETIAELSSTKWNYNKDTVTNLAAQRADTWVGIVLLLAAFALQMWNLLWPMRGDDFDVDVKGVLIAIVFGVLVLVASFLVSSKVAQITEARVLGILRRQT